MRAILLISILCLGSSVFACPNFSGNYVCKQKENKETQTHAVTVAQDADTIRIDDKEAGYTEGPFQLKSLTKMQRLDSEIVYSVTCQQNEIVVYGKGKKKSNIPSNVVFTDLAGDPAGNNIVERKPIDTLVTIKLAKTAKGYKGTWKADKETVESDCELRR